MKKNILPIIMGNMLEAYDFCLYGLLAVVFAKLFFPANYNYALTFSFLLFTIAYISRPFGSLLWGSLADRYGRKPILMATLAVMGISAVGMAIVPKYSSILKTTQNFHKVISNVSHSSFCCS